MNLALRSHALRRGYTQSYSSSTRRRSGHGTLGAFAPNINFRESHLLTDLPPKLNVVRIIYDDEPPQQGVLGAFGGYHTRYRNQLRRVWNDDQ
jgi:hypothetical protein